MTDDHPCASELERYIIGAQQPEDAQRLERHVAGCETCASALAREAQLEIKLNEVAASQPVEMRNHRRDRRVALLGGIAVAACAAAIVVLEWFRTPAHEDMARPAAVAELPRREVVEARANPEAPTYPWGIDCVVSMDAKQCLRDAQRRGLAVIAPTIQVPRYEYAAADQTR